MVLGLFCFIACQNRNSYLYDVPYSAMHEMGEPFCVVLYDSLYNTNVYVDRVKSMTSKRFIVDFINIDQERNQWYVKLLTPQILPVTCVFNERGNLLDILSGDSREVFLYTESSIINGRMNADYHYNQNYGDDKKRMIAIYDGIFKYKLRLDQASEDSYDSVPEVTIDDSLLYPYPLILKMQHRLQKEDTLAARNAAREIIDMISSDNILLYSDDLFSAHNVLDVSYHSESAPVIETIPDSFDLGVGCIGESTVQVLKIRNLGTHPLNVYNIMSSCSCIKHLSPVNEAVVGSDEEFEFAFMFTPDRTGDLLREIYIVSDSYQKPLVTIPVTCQVK